MWEPPDLESIAEPLEESEEEVPVGSGAKVAKGKARATPIRFLKKFMEKIPH